jgi:pimeloyl-ACP methyl ester carboxylesterase
MSDPRELRYDASGMSFGALAWGPDNGRLALCLHGYPDTAWTWRHLGPFLAERGWRVVAPFLRGYAPTDLAPDGRYQLGALARDAVGAHAALGGDGSAIVIGHDWGAEAAYMAAAHSPALFERVVALAVPPPPALYRRPRDAKLTKELILGLRQLRFSWYMLYQQLPGVSERSLDRLIPRLWADWSPGFDGREDAARVLAALDSPARKTAALRYYRALLQPWARSDEYADEQRYVYKLPQQPILYLHGEDDGCLQVEYARRTVAVLEGRGEVEIVPGSGHFLQLERPEVVNARIAEFVE